MSYREMCSWDLKVMHGKLMVWALEHKHKWSRFHCLPVLNSDKNRMNLEKIDP